MRELLTRTPSAHEAKLVEALKDILMMHDGNQPAALNMPELDYARRTIDTIHARVRQAIADLEGEK